MHLEHAEHAAVEINYYLSLLIPSAIHNAFLFLRDVAA